MAKRSASFTFSSLNDTRQFALALGSLLRPGDVLLLEGDIGAGKTYLARSLIQSLQTVPEDVPSPTFTLVQTYETGIGEIWHSDLYRIGTTDEIEELGLTDALLTGVCLIEWPDRLGTLAPPNALTIALRADETEQDRRHATLTWDASRWDAVVPELETEVVK